MRPLTTDLGREKERPYFLWDEDLTIEEFKRLLRGEDGRVRPLFLVKLLREARDIDVWRFVTPEEVAEAFPLIAHRLGRRRAFWSFLLGRWRRDGFLPE